MIRNLLGLESKGYLNEWDRLSFEGLSYRVCGRYLENTEHNNEKIFEELGISDKIGFCEEAYWYDPKYWDFPECEEWDYEALYRVAIKLYKLIENKDYNEIDIF